VEQGSGGYVNRMADRDFSFGFLGFQDFWIRLRL
jgi:hypothetical protein